MKSRTISPLFLSLAAGCLLSAPLAASASDLVGAWYGNGGADVFTFLGNGEYYLAENAGTTDMEHGTYSWNSATGAFASSTISDTNPSTGLSGSTGINIQVTGNTFAATVPNEGTFNFARVADSGNAIVGSWLFGTPGNSQAFTFLSNGTYFLADDGNPALDPSGQKGVESGTYS